MTAPPTNRLEAYQTFAAALCRFQAQAGDHETTAALLASAHEYGFSWFSRPAIDALGTRVDLIHDSGVVETAIGRVGDDPAQLLLGLLGGGSGFADLYARTIAPYPDGPDPEPDATPPAPHPDSILLAQPEPLAAEVAAESLAAATGGMVFELAEGDPATPLTEQQKAAAVQMVSDLSPAQRKSFAIAFRDGFNVPKTEKSILPSITELRHLQFIDRFTIEAAGGVAP